MGLEVEVKSFRESVQLDSAGGEESVWCWGGSNTEGKRSRGGEDSAGEETSKVTVEQVLLLMRGVIRVDKWRSLLGIIIILIVVLLDLSIGTHVVVLGSGLSSTGNVISTKDSGNMSN